MGDGVLLGATTVGTYAVIAGAIAALGLPLYQLRRDGFLPSLRRRAGR